MNKIILRSFFSAGLLAIGIIEYHFNHTAAAADSFPVEQGQLTGSRAVIHSGSAGYQGLTFNNTDHAISDTSGTGFSTRLAGRK